MDLPHTALILVAAMTSAYADARPARKVPPSKPATPFAAKLDGQLAKQRGNFISSPASISLALAMTREGARGDTAAAMDRVLGPDAAKTAKALTLSFQTPTQARDAPAAPSLAIANRLFGDKTTVFEQPFLDVTRRDYLAPAESVDFRNAFEAARKHINDWVAVQTRDKIKDLVPSPAVTAATRMILVNAIYMKASWETPFNKSLTKPAPFAIAGGQSKKVDTMHGTGTARWGAHGGARTIDLPYHSAGGPKLAMLVVVPNGASLAKVEATYAAQGIKPFLAATSKSGLAAVALPKFEVGTSLELSKSLKAMGMGLAFADAADFSGISKVATQISAVVHKAWAKVDENGTEAAAATAVAMASGGAPKTPHAFKVDRSFLFYVHDDAGNVLFGGRIIDPSVK